MMHDGFVRKVREKSLKPVVVVYGSDEYPIHQIVKAIRETYGGGSMAQFNVDELSGAAVTWDAVLERARTLPMMASQRLVLAWNVEKILKKGTPGLEEAEAYVAAPFAETLLVLIAAEMDKRTRFWKALVEGKADVFESRPPRLQEIPDLAVAFARQEGKKLDREAAELLRELVGAELMWVANEVKKLSLYVGERAEITADDVRELMADVSAHQVWDLTDALAARNFEACVRLLEGLLRDGAQPPMIFGALAGELRRIAKVKKLQEARVGRDAMIRALGMTDKQSFFLGKIVENARRFSAGQLANIGRRLNETDFRLKRSSQPAHLVLENLIADICFMR